MAALGLCLAYCWILDYCIEFSTNPFPTAYKELPISAYPQRQFSTLQLHLKEGQPICSQYKGVNVGNFLYSGK